MWTFTREACAECSALVRCVYEIIKASKGLKARSGTEERRRLKLNINDTFETGLRWLDSDVQTRS